MSKIHPPDEGWARRIIRSVKFTEGFRGDNVRRTKDSVYINGGNGGSQGAANRGWRPLPYIVKAVEDDYLTCRPYVVDGQTTGEREVKIAKPYHLRVSVNGGDWTVTPAYVPDVSVIWAAPFRNNGGKDGDDNLALMDLNLEGRDTSSFWAKITGSTADGDNKWTYAFTEQERTAGGWQNKTDGRTGSGAVNSAEANNSGSGVQGNGVDIDGSIFTDNSDLALKPIQGEPVVRMWEEALADGTKVYTFTLANAIDGECA